MEKVQGQRPMTFRYIYDGYTFHKDHSDKNYRCSARSTRNRCYARANVDEMGKVTLRGRHWHIEPTINIRQPAIRALKELAIMDFHRGVGEIVDEVFKDFPEASVIMKRKTARGHVYKARGKYSAPTLSNTIMEEIFKIHTCMNGAENNFHPQVPMNLCGLPIISLHQPIQDDPVNLSNIKINEHVNEQELEKSDDPIIVLNDD